MSVHAGIIKLLLSLDYTQDKGGVCQGISLRWLEAYLLDAEQKFNEHIQSIVNDGEKLRSTHKARKKNQPVTFTKKQVTTLAFCDSLMLYQDSVEYSALFGRYLWQGDVEAISVFASSDKIISRGGLTQIYSEPGIYTEMEIKQYLDDLAAILKSHLPLSKESFGIILSSNNHTIALGYKPCGLDGEWKLMDIEHYPSISFKSEETTLLAKKIMTSLQSNQSPYMTCNVSMFTLGNNSHVLELKNQLDQFKKKSVLTKEIVSRISHDNNLAFIAAEYGHVSVLAELAKYNKKHLDLADEDGDTPLYMAAQNGHAHVIHELAMHGANLNTQDKDGTTSAIIAAQMGLDNVIAELGKNKANLDKPDNDGITPAHIAAVHDHAKVIAVLAKYGANLNVTLSNGITPAYFAAEQGHVSVLVKLAKYGANLNAPNWYGQTPAFAAAENGHASVIAELGRHKKVNLNIPNIRGVTPAFIAAQGGHVAVIKELIKLGANFNLPFKLSADDLRGFASTCGDNVIERMNQFILNQPVNSCDRELSILPYDIAVIMGHKDIVKFLENPVTNTNLAQKRKAPKNVTCTRVAIQDYGYGTDNFFSTSDKSSSKKPVADGLSTQGLASRGMQPH